MNYTIETASNTKSSIERNIRLRCRLKSMEFDQYPGCEYVRPSRRSRGYLRKIPDRSPSPAQKVCREEFRKRAEETRGLSGTVVLPDGRRISRTAFELAGNDLKAQNGPIDHNDQVRMKPTAAQKQPAPQPEQMNAPSGQNRTEPAKQQISQVMQAPKARRMISLQDLIEAKALVQAVQDGKVTKQEALIRMLKKL